MFELTALSIHIVHVFRIEEKKADGRFVLPSINRHQNSPPWSFVGKNAHGLTHAKKMMIGFIFC